MFQFFAFLFAKVVLVMIVCSVFTLIAIVSCNGLVCFIMWLAVGVLSKIIIDIFVLTWFFFCEGEPWVVLVDWSS